MEKKQTKNPPPPLFKEDAVSDFSLQLQRVFADR